MTTAVAEQDTLQPLGAFMQAAAKPLRLRILQLLGFSSFGVLELVTMLDMQQSGVSHHLKLLAKAGWVTTRREGNHIFYQRLLPRSDAPFCQLKRQVFKELDAQALAPDVQQRLEAIQAQRAQQSRDFFARNAALFAERQDLIAEHQVYDDQAAKLLQLLCPAGGDSALEIGPGEGHFLLRLAERFRRVIGLDTEAALIQQASDRVAQAGLQKKVTLQQGEWPSQRPDSPQDLLVLNMVLHHLPAPREAIRACGQALRAGGKLLVTELCQHQQDWAKESCGDLWLGFSEPELTEWAAQADLVLVESQFAAQKNGFQIQFLGFEKKPDKPAVE